MAAIKKMQVTLKISDSSMEKRVREIYGCSVEELTKADAGHLIKVLQEVNKQPQTPTQPEQQQSAPLPPGGVTSSWCLECGSEAVWNSGVSRDKGPWGGYFCQDKGCKKVQWVNVK
jgi:hypothetical protein